MPALSISHHHYKYLDSLGSSLTFDFAIEEVSKEYRMQPYELLIKDRHRVICEPRQVACFIGMLHLQITCCQIADHFGFKHCSVLHSIKVVKNLYKTDKYFRNKLTSICQRLGISNEKLEELINRKNNYRFAND